VTLAVETVHFPLIKSLLRLETVGDRFEFVGLNGDIESLQKSPSWQEQVAKRDLQSLMTAVRVCKVVSSCLHVVVCLENINMPQIYC